MYSVRGLSFDTRCLFEHLTDQMVMGETNKTNLVYLIFEQNCTKYCFRHLGNQRNDECIAHRAVI